MNEQRVHFEIEAAMHGTCEPPLWGQILLVLLFVPFTRLYVFHIARARVCSP